VQGDHRGGAEGPDDHPQGKEEEQEAPYDDHKQPSRGPGGDQQTSGSPRE